MKESLKKSYHSLSWDFADYLSYRPQLRGNAKKKYKRMITKHGRIFRKKCAYEIINTD